MPFGLRMFGNKQLVADEHGQVLQVDGQPVEVESPSATLGAFTAGVVQREPEPSPQSAALEAENAELKRQLAAAAQEKADREAAEKKAAEDRIAADATALADEHVRAGGAPTDRARIESTYKALASADATNGTKLAAGYAEDVRASHKDHSNKLNEVVRTADPGLAGSQSKSGAAGYAAAGVPSNAASRAGGFSGPGFRVVDPRAGTETVKPAADGLDRGSLESLLSLSTEGRAALAAVKSGKVDWDSTAGALAKQFGG